MIDNLCRICLAKNIKMYCIDNSHLRDVYDLITSNSATQDVTVFTCYICTALLDKFNKLMRQAREAHHVMNHYVTDSKEIHDCLQENYYKLSIHRINMNVNTNGNEAENEMCVKREYKSEMEDVEVEFEDKAEPQDIMDEESDDELTLNEISMRKYVKVKKTVREKEENEDCKDMTLSASEIVLSKEEQLLEMERRSKSLNYLNSPYKCDLCYRGFVDPQAYGNHSGRHDESSGCHKCDVCHLRYSSERQLRAHVLASHSRKYQCTLCKCVLQTRHQAKEHRQWHNGRTYPCKICGQSFVKPTSYLTHVRKRHSLGNACTLCGDSFVGPQGLRMHIAKSHRHTAQARVGGISHKCNQCDVQFSSVMSLGRHFLSKHFSLEGKSTTCPICCESVRTLDVRRHVRAHGSGMLHPQLPTTVTCDQCECEFSSLAKLKYHVRKVHQGFKYNKNIVCEVCGKKFNSNAMLRYHQRIHTGEKPYGCGECSARFSSREGLRIHGRVHSGERPYSCNVCGKRFTQKPALNRHYRVHTGTKPYVCHFCSKAFNQSNSMKIHIDYVHLKLPRKDKHKKCTQ